MAAYNKEVFGENLSNELTNRVQKLKKTYAIENLELEEAAGAIAELIDEQRWSGGDLLIRIQSLLENCYHSLQKNTYNKEDFPQQEVFFQDGKIQSDTFLEYVYQYTRHLAFPNSVDFEFYKATDCLAELFLIFFQLLNNEERRMDEELFYNRYPMRFLTKEEESQLTFSNEYFAFKNAYEREYVFEMLKLSQEVKKYTTLDHISGVCYIALQIARQLKIKNVPIDLGMVVAASMGHDIGKYGAKKGEERRVPYLHYYYTDLWFEQRGMYFAGKVAANHSTWDLELENLQIESLVLIYADFRVKMLGDKMHIYDLSSSFQVILDKLDNVDEAKEKRYKRVYAKLKDFEHYMMDMGVHTDIESLTRLPLAMPPKDMALLYGKDISENLKFQAIEYNINILKSFSTLENFDKLLVSLGSEKSWRSLRKYIDLFQEYDKYIGKNQKLLILNILQELLLFKEEDVRNQAAEIIGIMIANFDEEYRKELPDYVVVQKDEQNSGELFERFLSYFLYKDHKQTQRNIEWLRINGKNMVSALFQTTSKPEFYHPVIARHLDRAIVHGEENIVLALTQILKHIRVNTMTDTTSLENFLSHFYNHKNVEIRLAVNKLIYIISKYTSKLNLNFAKEIIAKTEKSNQKVVNHQRGKMLCELGKRWNLDVSENIAFLESEEFSPSDITNIYLKNLKSATGWIEKKANIDIMVGRVLRGEAENNLQTALHFCNLLKVSATESVRNHSGKAVLKIIDYLPEQEKNEVSVELIRALEMQDIQFTKYIPKYIGPLLIHLPPNELDEILDDFYVKVKTATPQLTWLILLSVGYSIEEYLHSGYTKDRANFDKRLEYMLGILMIGLYSFESSVSNESLKILADLFGSDKLDIKQKYKIFSIVDKRLLHIVAEKYAVENNYIKNSASLNKIYRFISDYEFFEGEIRSAQTDKIAFFPGSFDPFSLGHKAIAEEIRNQGYDVFLAIDEFSWSKQTQPNEIRKNIIKCSIADEQNIYVFPNRHPINIANDADIRKLVSLFPGKEISIVVGSDVVKNASSYHEGKNGEILRLNHIIFHRKSDDKETELLDLPTDKINNISGRVEILSLKPQYEFISSTLIRDAVDEDRDISELIDYQAQNYIYKYSLYKKAPQYKFSAPRSNIQTQIIENVTREQLDDILHKIDSNNRFVVEGLADKLNYEDAESPLKMISLLDEESGEIIAFATGFWLRSQKFYREFTNTKISEYLRNETTGRVFVINSHWVKEQYSLIHLSQIIMTETLAYAIGEGYSFCIYHNKMFHSSDKVTRLLKSQGFIELEQDTGKPSVFIVNMANPIVLNLDLRSIVKDPFRNNPSIRRVIYEMREKLQLALTGLFPGELVISFDRKTTYAKLVKKVCELNEVSEIPSNPRVLGQKICVSYGTILTGSIVPNTVTKSLHTEKVYAPNLKTFTIEQYPNYMDIGVQIETINSFNRPVILIDDILHKGYRLQKMWPMFAQKDVFVSNLVVAILSGRGQEVVEQYGGKVDYIYYLPSIRNWFNENAMYPFIGGDYVKREGQKESFLLPSLNYILPYAYPAFIKGASREDIYKLSETCIENAIMFFEEIEKEYQQIYEKSFSLYQLREIFEKTRTPDYGKSVELDLNAKPSEYLKNDLEKLKRLKNMFIN
ncbi:MAG: hypothetical protein Q4D65_06635 [Peptostreptococcaceae bacterium]|nr:hypothetical protein [Peptostreptococcaceae bacterium]